MMHWLARKAGGLPLHVFHHDVEDFSERGAVGENLPRAVGMKVDLNQRFVANCKQAVAFEVCGDVVKDLVLAELLTGEEKLRVKFKLEHGMTPYHNFGRLRITLFQ